MAKDLNVHVVVLNYNPQAIGELTIQEQYIGGVYWGYGPGGTGGKIYCCIDVTPGPAKVKWTYGGKRGAPKAGEQDEAVGNIPQPTSEFKYLGVHVYPTRTVEFTLSRNIPAEKAEGE